MTSKLQVNTDFSGGNIVIESIEEDVVELRPDLRDNVQFMIILFVDKDGVEPGGARGKTPST